MSKKEASPVETVKVMQVYRAPDEGYASAFAYQEFEIPKAVFEKYAKKVDESNPDIFAIFMNVLTKKCRDILGI